MNLVRDFSARTKGDFRPFCANMCSTIADVVVKYGKKEMRSPDWKLYFYSRDDRNGQEKEAVCKLLGDNLSHCTVYCFAQTGGWLKYTYGAFESVVDDQED